MAYVRPSLSLNSTSYTPGARSSTTVPTCPRVRPCSGTSSRSATVCSRGIFDAIRHLSSHEARHQTRKILTNADDPSTPDVGSSKSRCHCEVYHVPLAELVA